jgi:hypothetical protein
MFPLENKNGTYAQVELLLFIPPKVPMVDFSWEFKIFLYILYEYVYIIPQFGFPGLLLNRNKVKVKLCHLRGKRTLQHFVILT